MRRLGTLCPKYASGRPVWCTSPGSQDVRAQLALDMAFTDELDSERPGADGGPSPERGMRDLLSKGDASTSRAGCVPATINQLDDEAMRTSLLADGLS